MIANYPGNNDLYECATHISNCEDPAEPELWFGNPTSGKTQICPDCESDSYRSTKSKFEGHGLTLDKVKAWQMVQAGLEAANTDTSNIEPRYHIIPAGAHSTEDIYVIAVPIPSASGPSRTRYLCMQIEPFTDEDDATFTRVKPGTGAQLSVEYDSESAHRNGNVWLK